MIDSTAFVGVGVAIVQVVLRVSGDGGAADALGDVGSLWDRLRELRPSPGRRVVSGERIAEEIARELPVDQTEYQDVPGADWKVASEKVAGLLRYLPDSDRRSAGYRWKELKKTLLDSGGKDSRAGLADESAKVAFDWVLEVACQKVVACFTQPEALQLVLENLEETGDVLRELRDRPVPGQPVGQVLREHRDKLRRLAPETLKDREREIAALEEFVLRGQETWLAYEARMLSGKTALMATFALSPPDGVHVVSFFVRKNEAGRGRKDFVFQVMAQLADILGDRYVRSLQMEEQPSALAHALRMAALSCEEQEQALVLLIDGLDEDAYFEDPDAPGAASILSVLPRDLPRGVKVVTASRPNPPVPTDVVCENRQTALSKDLEPSPHAEVSVSPEQVRKFFGRRLGLPIGTFLAACEGMLTAQDLHSLVSRGDDSVTLGDVDSFVAGELGRLLLPTAVGRGRRTVMAYQLGHDVVLREVLRHLDPQSVGEGDDPEDEQWWAELRLRTLRSSREVIVKWARDLATRRGWSATTPSYLLSDGYQAVVRDIRQDEGVLELLADSGRNDEIVRRYGSAHRSLRAIDESTDAVLTSSDSNLSEGLLKDLLSIAEERARLVRGTVYVPGLLSLGVEYFDLEPRVLLGRLLSIDDINKRVDAIEEVLDGVFHGGQRRVYGECILEALDSVNEQRVERVDRVRVARAKVLAGLGRMKEAESVIASVEAPASRSGAFVGIARVLTEAGETDKALEVAELARQAATESAPGWRVMVLADVVRVLAVAGGLDRALEVAEQAMHTATAESAPELRAEALTRVARVLAEVGETVQALEVAEAVRRAAAEHHSWSLEGVLADVVRVLAEAGEPNKALEVAGQVDDPLWQAMAMTDVARLLAEVGETAQALEVAELAKRAATAESAPELRAKALTRVARVLAEVGEAVQVLQVAEVAKQAAAEAVPWQRAEALADVARVLAEVGETDKALEVAGQVDDPGWRAKELADVARVLAEAGDLDWAQEVAELAKQAAAEHDSWSRGKALAEMVRVLAEAGEPDRAMEVAGQVDPPGRRAEALADVARVLAEAGEPDRALEVAGQVDYPRWQVRALADVARVLAEVGETAQALEVAELARQAAFKSDLGFRAEALACAAQALAEAGEPDKALEVAGQVDEPGGRAVALADVARVLVEAGEPDKALEIATLAKQAAAKSESWRRAEALARIAQVLAEAGGLDEALAVAELAKEAAAAESNPRWRAVALAGVARVLVEAGDTDEALAVAELAKEAAAVESDPGWRAVALAGVARVLVEAGDRDEALAVAELAKEAAAESASGRRAVALADVARVLSEAGRTERVMSIVRDELRWADGLTERREAAEYCGRLASICLGVSGTPGLGGVEISEWHGLARGVLARSWLFGASVWEHVDVLSRVAPDLASRLIDERLLDSAEPS